MIILAMKSNKKIKNYGRTSNLLYIDNKNDNYGEILENKNNNG